MGRLFLWPGIGLLALCLYSGFKGPVKVGEFSIQKFDYNISGAPTIYRRPVSRSRPNETAISYARNQVSCKGRYIPYPDLNRAGGEGIKLSMSVYNKGSRDLSSLTVSVYRAFKNGKAETITVTGPFASGVSRGIDAYNVVGNSPGRKTIKVRRATY